VYSLIVPVYRNAGSIPDLVRTLQETNRTLHGRLEVVFVVDGSPDESYALLAQELPRASFASKLILLSRNYGSFAAIRVGLGAARGPYFATMAADLQEPPELVLEFFRSLEQDEADVVIGTRLRRRDSFGNRIASGLFWWAYRRFVVPEMPRGGVDVFGCNLTFRDQLLRLEESRSSLIAQLFWLGFRRKLVSYDRLERRHGASAWTLGKRMNYMTDSVFAFTDLPIRLLFAVGGGGVVISLLLGLVTAVARLTGWIAVPGYATTVLVVLFFGALNAFGLGLVGSYAWRAYENTKRRPSAIPMSVTEFPRRKSKRAARAAKR